MSHENERSDDVQKSSNIKTDWRDGVTVDCQKKTKQSSKWIRITVNNECNDEQGGSSCRNKNHRHVIARKEIVHRLTDRKLACLKLNKIKKGVFGRKKSDAARKRRIFFPSILTDWKWVRKPTSNKIRKTVWWQKQKERKQTNCQQQEPWQAESQ